MDIDVEFGGQSSAWSVTVPASSDITVEPSSGTGNGTFTMTFPVNSSTTSSVERTVTVTSGSTSRTVTITQNPLEFSVNPASQTIDFNVTSAEVTVFAPDGIAWTASVSGNGTSLSTSGTGPQTLTVTLPKNNTTSQRTFTITARLTDQNVAATAQLIQKNGPDSPSTFGVDSFTYDGSNRSGKGTSADGFISISFSNIGNDDPDYWAYGWGPIYDEYIQMGRRRNRVNYRGGITVTPASGIKITSIIITYSNANNAGYDFGNTPVEVNTGLYERTGNNTNQGAWTGSSESPITFTNGFQNNGSNYNFPRITRIVVEYEAI